MWHGAGIDDDAPRHPLLATRARMGALSAFFRFDIGVPDGADWFVLPSHALLDDLPRWVDALVAAGHAPDEAGVTLATALVGPVTRTATVALTMEHRRLRVGPGDVQVHRTRDGWFDALALADVRFDCLDGDAEADHHDATVMTLEALRAAIAADVVATIGPIHDVVHARIPFGRRGLWGNVADLIVTDALWAQREAGATMSTMRRTWEDAAALLDEIAALLDEPLNRARAFPVAGLRTDTLMPVRGTCCLFYKSPGSPALCRTCPLLDDATRRRDLGAWWNEISTS